MSIAMLRRSFQFNLRKLLGVVTVFGVLCALVTSMRKVDDRLFQEPRCETRLKKINTWIRGIYGDTLPPAVLYSSSGRPLQSWRAMVAVAGAFVQGHRCPFDLAKPWDAPENRRWQDQLNEFVCPASDRRLTEYTSYVAVVGEDTMWPGKARTRIPEGIQSDTILLIEVPNSNIPWMQPRDVTVDELWHLIGSPSGKGICCSHADGLPYLAIDGRVLFLSRNTDYATLRRLVRRDPRCEVIPCDHEEFVRQITGFPRE